MTKCEKQKPSSQKYGERAFNLLLMYIVVLLTRATIHCVAKKLSKRHLKYSVNIKKMHKYDYV